MSPLSWNVAVKFLMARKFDVLRAIELFHSYRVSERGWSPPSEGFLLCRRSLLLRTTLPLLLFLFLSPLQVLSSWKILFQPRRVAMEISPMPIPSPPLGAAHGVPSWLGCAAHRAFPYILRISMHAFSNLVCKAAPSVTGGCAGK